MGEIEDRLGRCYELAAEFTNDIGSLVDKDSVRLIHGSIQGGEHPRLGHAWVTLEIDKYSVIWEPVSNQILPPDLFFESFNARVATGYTIDEARQMMVTVGTYGPWHDRPFGLLDCSHGRDDCDHPRCAKED